MSFFPPSSRSRERVEPLTAPPSPTEFVSLEEHQAATPASFFDAPPVLYHHATKCKLVASRRDFANTPHLRAFWPSSTSESLHSSDDDEYMDAEIVLNGIDVWVTSKRFLIYREEAKAGLSIPYLLIKLHAVRSLSLATENIDNAQGLWVSYTDADQHDEEEEEPMTNLTFVPSSRQEEASAPGGEVNGESPQQAEEALGQKLYDAVTACSNLYPDPLQEDSDEDGLGYTGVTGGEELFQQGMGASGGAETNGLPPPFPGSGGWITAENVHEHFDEEGNWRNNPAEPSGGTVRPREQNDDGKETGGEDAKRIKRTEE